MVVNIDVQCVLLALSSFFHSELAAIHATVRTACHRYFSSNENATNHIHVNLLHYFMQMELCVIVIKHLISQELFCIQICKCQESREGVFTFFAL